MTGLLLRFRVLLALGIILGGCSDGLAQGVAPLTAQYVDSVMKDASTCGAYLPLHTQLMNAGTRQRKAEAAAAVENLGRRVPLAVADTDEQLTRLKVIYERLPFFFEISGPCARLAAIAGRAKKRYEDPVVPPLEELNRDGVSVRVRPSRIGQDSDQEAMENLVALTTKERNQYASPAARLLEELRQQGDTQSANPFDLARPIENVIVKRGAQVIRPVRKDVKPLTIRNATGAAKEVNVAEFFFSFEAFAPSSDIVLVLISGDSTFEWPINTSELAANVK